MQYRRGVSRYDVAVNTDHERDLGNPAFEWERPSIRHTSIERVTLNRLHSPVLLLRWIASNTKRLLVLVVGMTLVGAGLAMLVLPGPGIIVSIAGLVVLSTEFVWAERVLDRSKAKAIDATNKMAASRASRIALGASAIGLITGGAAAASLSEDYRALGVGITVSGIATLSLLLPKTRYWLTDRVGPGPTTSLTLDPTTSAPPTSDRP